MKLKRLAYLAFTFSIPCFLQAQQAKMNIGIEAVSYTHLTLPTN